MKKIFLAIILILQITNANEWGVKNIDILMASKHVGDYMYKVPTDKVGFNETNPGFIFNFENDFSLGVVKNSFNRYGSVIKYTMYGDQSKEGLKVSVGLEGAIPDKIKNLNGDIEDNIHILNNLPFIALEYRYKNLKLAAMPAPTAITFVMGLTFNTF